MSNGPEATGWPSAQPLVVVSIDGEWLSSILLAAITTFPHPATAPPPIRTCVPTPTRDGTMMVSSATCQCCSPDVGPKPELGGRTAVCTCGFYNRLRPSSSSSHRIVAAATRFVICRQVAMPLHDDEAHGHGCYSSVQLYRFPPLLCE